MTIEWRDFEEVGLRAGTIVRVEDFPKARKPAFKLWIDLGEIGGDVVLARPEVRVANGSKRE